MSNFFEKLKIIEKVHVDGYIDVDYCEPLDSVTKNIIVIYIPLDWLESLHKNIFGVFDNYEYEFVETLNENEGAIVIYSYTELSDAEVLVNYMVEFIRSKFESDDSEKLIEQVPDHVLIKWLSKDLIKSRLENEKLQRKYESLVKEKKNWYELSSEERKKIKVEVEYQMLKDTISKLQKDLGKVRTERDTYLNRYLVATNK